VLADRLRELAEAEVVGRGADGYLLTARGRDLLERLLPLEAWSVEWQNAVARTEAPPGSGTAHPGKQDRD
jgi:DNA-binding HxlR family transcriptional regulator